MRIPITDLMSHLPNLQRYARRLTRNDDQANDLVQETIARALRHFDRYEPTGSLQGWLITIMKNQFRETQRRRLKHPTVPYGDGLGERDGRSFGAPQDHQLLLRELAEAIPRLPAFQRDLLLAVCVQGLSYEEAGSRFGIPIGTVRSRLFRARTALQSLLEPLTSPAQAGLDLGLRVSPLAPLGDRFQPAGRTRH